MTTGEAAPAIGRDHSADDRTDAPDDTPLPAPTAPVDRYDQIAYPSTVIPRVDPDRLATIARLHGIAAAPVERARVLEVGGGNGRNLVTFAAAFPESRCLTFDLAATVVAQGQAFAREAEVDNIRLERLDILDAAETLDGEFDFVVVHGVLAWVPEAVRAAIFRLIGRVLAPNGVAVVSYNALPGQQLSITLRAMIGTVLADLPIGEDRVHRAIALLRDYAATERPDDNSFVKALRHRAGELAERPFGLLAHDEFGSVFEPQLFETVCALADAEGLTYLNDSIYENWKQGFPGVECDAATLQASMQLHDYQTGCLFRHSLFVRQGLPIRRVFDAALARDLRLSSSAAFEDGQFRATGGSFAIPDHRLAVLLREAARRYPMQFSLEGMDDDRLALLVQLFLNGGVFLSATPTPAGDVTATPRLSPLARAQIGRGERMIAGLDRQPTELSDDFRRLLLLLDGTRDAAALARDVGIAEGEAVAFLGLAAQRALLMP